ncbi:MAG: sigma factor-like helix-turn-helix DNA-binding protein [Actinomycetes bacterium]|jgi:DNA-directed RNA polymerase sigma subunit (sigma70/sigma32)
MNQTNTLSASDVEILTLRFGLNGTPPMTLEEIADRLGCSREKVRWRESLALRAAQNNPQLRRIAGKEYDENVGTSSTSRPTRLVF